MASNKIQFRSIHELKDPSLNGKLAAKEFQNEIPVMNCWAKINPMIQDHPEEISLNF